MNIATSLHGWRPSPFLAVSFALQFILLALLLFAPEYWRWVLAIVLLDYAAIVIAGLLPRCTLLGKNLVRLPAAAARRGEIALTFDDGPDPDVTPRVLDILDQYQARATFFCIGEKAAAHPDLCRRIVACGHAIENHGQRHHNAAAFSGIAGWLREIGDAQDTLQSITGKRPQYFRALAGLRNPSLDPALYCARMQLASWTRRGYDTRCNDADTVLARLTRDLAAGDILLMHDGNSARDKNGNPVILAALPRLLEHLAARDFHAVPLPPIPTMPPDLKNRLLDIAASPYEKTGRINYQWARGKLKHDPIFPALIEHKLFPDGASVLDLGCGRGLLAAWMLGAERLNSAGEWRGDAPPTGLNFRGIDLMEREILCGNRALQPLYGERVQLQSGDMRDANLDSARIIAMLDVLHYIPRADQDALLDKARAALGSGGLLVARVGNANGGLRFTVSLWVDRLIMSLRTHRPSRLYCRPLDEWERALTARGFKVRAIPMSGGTPFANVLLIGELP